MASATAATLMATSPSNAATPPRDPRLVVILQHSAPDGGVGWLNRAAEVLRGMGRARSGNLLAIGSSTPAIMRGPAPTLICAPGALHCIRPERLGEHLDKHGALERPVVIAAPLTLSLSAPSLSFPTAAGGAGIQESALRGPWIPARAARVGNDTYRTAAAIGQALAALQGMRIGVIELDNSSERDCVIAALAQEMEPVWRDTVIIATGAASSGPLVGGAVRNGRLVDGRELLSVCAGILRDHFDIPSEVLKQSVFPEMRSGKHTTPDQTQPPSTT